MEKLVFTTTFLVYITTEDFQVLSNVDVSTSLSQVNVEINLLNITEKGLLIFAIVLPVYPLETSKNRDISTIPSCKTPGEKDWEPVFCATNKQYVYHSSTVYENHNVSKSSAHEVFLINNIW